MPSEPPAAQPPPATRPLSPHIQIYKPQLTSVLSILHRITGVALALGAVLLVWWLAAAAAGPRDYRAMQEFMGSDIGLLLLLGWSAALFFHLTNGIRHLFWDAGLGFELNAVYQSGWSVVAVTLVLTLGAWLLGLSYLGGG